MADSTSFASRSARRKLASGVFVILSGLATLLALTALTLILYSLLRQGVAGLDLKVFTMSTPAPGSQGGLLNAIVGSALLCATGMAIAVVIGVLAGTWLAEIGGSTPYGHAVRFLNDVLLSAPSILIGLFVYEILVKRLFPLNLFGVHSVPGFSGWAGAVALALLATPIVTRTTEDMLKLQPNTLREAGMALGAPQWVTVRRIIWRAAAAGLLTGGLLGFARISGETAPLLFTSVNNQFYSVDMSGWMASLPVAIYNFANSAYDDWRRLAWAGALIISVVVLTVNIIGRILTREPRYR